MCLWMQEEKRGLWGILVHLYHRTHNMPYILRFILAALRVQYSPSYLD